MAVDAGAGVPESDNCGLCKLLSEVLEPFQFFQSAGATARVGQRSRSNLLAGRLKKKVACWQKWTVFILNKLLLLPKMQSVGCGVPLVYSQY